MRKICNIFSNSGSHLKAISNIVSEKFIEKGVLKCH